MSPDRKAKRHLAALLSETRSVARARRRRLGPHVVAELAAVQAEARMALESGDLGRIAMATASLEAAARVHGLADLRKSLTRSYFEVILLAAGLALAVRLVCVEVYRIPSGSMLPTLHPGDVVLVNKLAYGVRLPWGGPAWEGAGPRRGEVVVFRDPRAGERELIKRVAGVAGDEIEVNDETLFVNGEAQPRSLATDRFEYWNYRFDLKYWHPQSGELYLEELDGHRHATIHSRLLPRPRPKEGPFRVPEGHVFVLGDNRDDSEDGRTDGGWYVPLENVKGRAALVAISWGKEGLRLWGEEGLLIDRILRPVDGGMFRTADLAEAASRLGARLAPAERETAED
ncbi:signal peptidase I [Vulgatibacter incomptus]|uniref:Signal peptidase I n=1 Tax=Vulgatibacter incomptus TaxID=1391653 RepID=A0A0K1PC00_9BACT|nr:signal peptidase I [Vulgatibacter incomptus]AKU91027.1 Signal peptidase I [Vulgatibacter incomptus]